MSVPCNILLPNQLSVGGRLISARTAHGFPSRFVRLLRASRETRLPARDAQSGNTVAPIRPARKARGTILTIRPLKAVERMHPARDEIIIATGVKLRDCGVQLWGWRSLGIFAGRPARSCGRPAGPPPSVAYRDPAQGRARDRERFRKRVGASRKRQCPSHSRAVPAAPLRERVLASMAAPRRKKWERWATAKTHSSGAGTAARGYRAIWPPRTWPDSAPGSMPGLTYAAR